MRPDEAKTISDFLLSTIESEIATTASVLGAVPADRLDYRPDGLSKSALGLVRHLTIEDEWFLNMIADRRFSPPPDSESDACGISTPAQAVERYKKNMPAAIARVRQLSGPQFAEEMELFGTMRMPVASVLSLMLRHSTHHRGQLTSYLRAMGGKVPSIYGPSADTQTAAAV